MFLDSCFFVTTKKTLTRQVTPVTKCRKWELYWTRSIC